VELTHSFTVPASVEDTWATFMDLEKVGACFPGATVTSATEDGFEGTVKVKLGPIALVYAGSGTFTERDDTAHRAVIEAKGKDKRGNGTAGATVTIQLSDTGEGSTRAEVQTDLAVTGKPAQFGRGVMQDVSDKLLQQFVDCIEGRFAEPPAAAQVSHPNGTRPAPPPDEQTPAPAQVSHPNGTRPAPPPDEQTPAPAQVSHPNGTRSAPAAPSSTDDALDLGSTVLPVLLRTYGKQAAATLLGLLAIVGLARRRRRRRAG
jgi:carbon monoxide dehydrogenase subunit G